MKNIITIILLLCFVTVIHAQSKSNLTISTTGATNLKITFNNKKYSLQDRSATFQSLNPGSYPLIIFQLQVNNGNREYKKVYDGNVRLNAGKHVEMIVMRFGKTSWDEGDIVNDEWNDNYSNPQSVNENDNKERNNSAITSASKFNLILKALKDEYNEDKMLELAKVIFKNNLFSIQQVKEMCRLFYNEDKMLAFVKFTYDYCADKDVYFSLGDLLFSTDRKKSLLDFIGSK